MNITINIITIGGGGDFVKCAFTPVRGTVIIEPPETEAGCLRGAEVAELADA